MKTTSFEMELAGKTLIAEFNDLTAHTNGSVMLRYGETVILVTAVMSDRQSSANYFPLSVEFEEKFYAAGQILGSRFMRREGKPSDEAVLSARIVDRTIRPLFNQSTRNDIQVVVSVLALGEDDPDVLAVIGASLALSVSDIPWNGPVGAIRIARVADTKELLINPTYTARLHKRLDIELFACGKDGTINMIETGAYEASEADIMEMLTLATTQHALVEAFQKKIVATIGKAKKEVVEPELPPQLLHIYESEYKAKLQSEMFSGRAGKDHIYAVKKEFLAAAKGAELNEAIASDFFEENIDAELHKGALERNERADGRAMDEVRELYAQAGGISPVLHGSGIFYRGGTHIFSALTLGGLTGTAFGPVMLHADEQAL